MDAGEAAKHEAERREALAARWRAAILIAGAGTLALAYRFPEWAAWIAATLGSWLFTVVIVVLLVWVFALAIRALFLVIERNLAWIHPALGIWLRRPPIERLAWVHDLDKRFLGRLSLLLPMLLMVALCAVAIAIAINSPPMAWADLKLERFVFGLLGERQTDEGPIRGTLRSLAEWASSVLKTFFGQSPWLADRSRGWLSAWSQVLALAGGFLAGLKRTDDAQRLNLLAAPPASQPESTASLPPRKRILVFCDGTSNSATQRDGGVEAPTNVYRLYTALRRHDWNGMPQVAIYDPGVGTDTSRQARAYLRIRSLSHAVGAKKVSWIAALWAKGRGYLELATGAGISENIEQGYREIVRVYEPGDEIWLFGFSRGAYTARCIAGVIYRCGLLRRENIRFVPDAMELYLGRREEHRSNLLKSEFIHSECPVRIKFMGLWDTVGSLGVPLWGWWFRIGAFGRFQGLNNQPAKICDHVCHALAIDETRSQFMPTLFELRPNQAEAERQTIEQVWFRGGHAEVGGGYAEHDLADLALHWMVEKATADGMFIDRSKLPRVDSRQHALAPVNTAIMRNPRWAVFGTWPRWHPAEQLSDDGTATSRFGQSYGVLDVSVRRRAAAATAAVAEQLRQGHVAEVDLRAAADGFIFLKVGQSATVSVRADRIWNRTGVVLERGATYEIAAPVQTTEPGTGWRDKEGDACGAGGDRLTGTDLRLCAAWAKRYPQARYLTLIGHVAHPRPWPAREFGGLMLLRYFLYRDPQPLRASLMTLDRPMTRVTLRCASGVFYAFANDLWATYANNSGALEVTIKRVADDGDRDFTITERGEVKPGAIEDGDGDRAWTRADA